MTLDAFVGLFGGGFALLVKILILLLILLYGVFAAVVTRQVILMNEVVRQVKFSNVILGVALVHLGATIFLFIIALIIL